MQRLNQVELPISVVVIIIAIVYARIFKIKAKFATRWIKSFYSKKDIGESLIGRFFLCL